LIFELNPPGLFLEIFIIALQLGEGFGYLLKEAIHLTDIESPETHLKLLLLNVQWC
jgi:hypothetical protein